MYVYLRLKIEKKIILLLSIVTVKENIKSIYVVTWLRNMVTFLFISKNILCDVPFNTDQKQAFLVPVKKAFGEISGWDDATIKKICSVIEIIPPTQIVKLSAKAVNSHQLYCIFPCRINNHTR